MIQLDLANLWIEDTSITKARPTTKRPKKKKKKRPKNKKTKRKKSASSSSATESESSETEESSAEYETVDNEIDEGDNSVATYNRKLQEMRNAIHTKQLLADMNLTAGITKLNENEGITPSEPTRRQGGRNTGAIAKADRILMSNIAAAVPEVPAALSSVPAAKEAISDRRKKNGKKKN